MKIRNLLWIGILVCVSHAAVDTVYMTIEASGVRAIPIGVTDFSKSPDDWSILEEQPAQTIQRDFSLTGKLEPIYQAQYNRMAFYKARAAYYMGGSLSKLKDGKIKMECRLHAVQSQDLIVGESYQVQPGQIRQALHRCADKMIWQVTGSQGFASSRLAYVGMVNGHKQIFVSDYDGFSRFQVTKDTSTNIMPTWGRDPDKLYFVSFRSGTSQVYERALSTADTRILFSSLGQAFAPAASPVSDEVLFTVTKNGASDIWKGVVGSGKAERLTFQRAAETSPSWSPNGKEVLFSSDKGGSPQVYLMDKDGSDVRRITYLGRYNESATWAPTGDRIAYTSMDEGRFNIYTCALNGSDVVQLTSNAGNNEHPTWSPDGSMIAFSSDRSGSYQIYVMRRDGSGLTRITNGGEYTWPSWSTMLFTQNPNGETP